MKIRMRSGSEPRPAAGPELSVEIPAGDVVLPGDLLVPVGARGVVLFAHGSGSSRRSPRNRQVAGFLQHQGLATLLFDLLSPEEEAMDVVSGALRFDIPFLGRRLLEATRWLAGQKEWSHLGLGYFGSSTGAAAALLAAAELGPVIDAVVSRGGRPDLAEGALGRVEAPTLLIVGGHDEVVLQLNRHALGRLHCPKELHIVPGATHLFEEHGALAEVSRLAAAWFTRHLHPR